MKLTPQEVDFQPELTLLAASVARFLFDVSWASPV